MTLPGGSQEFTKIVYDGLGDETDVYTGYDSGLAAALGTADAYTEATAIGSSDVVLTQSIDTFDAAGDQTFEADYNRLPGDTATTGALTSSDAQVSYTADWFDGIGRNVADDDYGAIATAPDPPSATNPAPTSSRFHGGDASVVHGLRCRRRGLPAYGCGRSPGPDRFRQ